MSRKEDWLDLSRSMGLPLLHESPFGVLVGNLSGRIIYVNPAMCTLLGYSLADFETTLVSWMQLTPPEFAARDAQAIDELLLTGKCTPYEKEYIAKDGRRVPILIGASVLEHAPSSELLVAAFITDLTPLRQTERTLHESDALLDTLFTSAPIGMSFVDCELRYVRVNEHLAAMNQLTVAAHIGHIPSELFSADTQMLETYWRHVIATGEPLNGIEISSIVAGRERHVLASYYPVRDLEGQILGIGGLMVDITERTNAERTSALLATLSSMLASTLNEQDLLAEVTRQLVPSFADLCMTWLVTDAGEIQRIELAHVLPDKAVLMRAMHERYPPNLYSSGELAQVIRTGVSKLAPSFQDHTIEVIGEDTQFRALVAQINPQSFLTVALRARHMVLGAIQFVITENARRFTPDDLVVAEEIARRCALAIDNVRLDAAEQHTRHAIERVVNRLARLQMATAALTEAVTTEQVGRVLVEQCAATIGAYIGALFVREDEYPVLSLIYHSGHTSGLKVPYTSLPLTLRVPLTEAVQTKMLVAVASRADLEMQYPASNSGKFNQLTEAVIAIPLLADERAIAGIVLSFDMPFVLDADDRVLLLTIARLGAQALERARLYDMEQRARQIAERAMLRISRVQTLTSALVNAVTREAVVETIVGVGRLAVGAEVGMVVLLTDNAAEFVLAGAVGLDPLLLAPWRRFPSTGASPFADAAREQLPVFIGSREEWQRQYPEQALASAELNDEAFAAIPLVVEARIIGAIGFSFRQAQMFSLEDRALMVTFAQQCAQSLERVRLYDIERRARERQAFLADASRVLAGSLNHIETLQTIAQFAVPAIADFCTIHLVEADGTIRQLAVAHRDPALVAHLEDLERRYPIQPDDPYGLPEVIRTRTPLLRTNMPSSMLDDFAQSDSTDDRITRLQALQIQSYMCLPLIARDRILGALSLFTAGPNTRCYGADDLQMAEDLAQRCAQAMDNAWLYHEASEAVRTRDTFLSIAAHELKTPLTSLLGNAQLLERRLARNGALDERNQHSISVVLDQSRRLNKLITELFDLSRIELGQLRLALAPVDLGVLIQQIVDEVQPVFAEHDLRFSSIDAPLFVEGDRLRLEQVFQNLISNSVKYSAQGSQVHMTLSRRGDSACIAISDQGIGIPTDAIPKLFQRFYRAPNVRAEQISGVGVGLFVVKEIVTLHGGTIEVSSTEGVGSTFTVLLPLKEQ